MRVVVLFPLFLSCVMQNGISHAQFQSCTFQSCSIQNIKEQYRKILPLFPILTPFLFFSYDSELHLSALSSDTWESHPNANFIIAPINLHHFFLISLEECVAHSSPLKFLVNMSASFSLDLTKIIFLVPLSTYSFDKLVSDVHMFGLTCSVDILSHKYCSHIVHTYYDGGLYANLHVCK